MPRAAAALVIAAAASCLMAGQATASHNDLRFGLQSELEPTPEEFQRMGRADAGMVRLSFEWRDVDDLGTVPGPYDWTVFDRQVEEAVQRKVPVLPVLSGSPPDVSDNPRWPPTTDAELDGWRDFLKAFVGRYGRGGDYWCDSYDPPETAPPDCNEDYRPITAHQPWNEPNLDAFWAKDPNPREYAELLELSRRAIQSRDEDATIVMAGMPELPTFGMRLKDYVRKLYDVPGIKNQFDVFALHPYAKNQLGVDGAIDRLRGWLRDEGDGKRTLWITEVGWATGGDDVSDAFRKSPSQQATLLKRAFELFQDKRSEYRLGTIIWYSFRDRVPPPGRDGQWSFHTGLFYTDGEPKPAWQKFVSFTGGESGGDEPLTPLAGASAQASASALAQPAGAELRPSPPE